MTEQKQSPISQSAATDVPDLIQELGGGQFERMLSIALSQSAAAAVDNGKVAEVNVKFKLKPISGTHQIHCEHELVFKKPTSNGKTSEQAAQTTTLHVGKFGKLTLIPESQTSFLDKTGKVSA